MQFPQWYARWNRRATNRVVRLWAGRVAGMGLLEHTGRVSGRAYQTPLVVFPAEGGVVIQVGYGPETEWLRNVRAAGGCRLRYRGRVLELGAPQLMTKPEARALVARRWQGFYRVVPFDEAVLFPLVS